MIWKVNRYPMDINLEKIFKNFYGKKKNVIDFFNAFLYFL